MVYFNLKRHYENWKHNKNKDTEIDKITRIKGIEKIKIVKILSSKEEIQTIYK